jgi:hypothetical protein
VKPRDQIRWARGWEREKGEERPSMAAGGGREWRGRGGRVRERRGPPWLLVELVEGERGDGEGERRGEALHGCQWKGEIGEGDRENERPILGHLGRANWAGPKHNKIDVA